MSRIRIKSIDAGFLPVRNYSQPISRLRLCLWCVCVQESTRGAVHCAHRCATVGVHKPVPIVVPIQFARVGICCKSLPEAQEMQVYSIRPFYSSLRWQKAATAGAPSFAWMASDATDPDDHRCHGLSMMRCNSFIRRETRCFTKS